MFTQKNPEQFLFLLPTFPSNSPATVFHIHFYFFILTSMSRRDSIFTVISTRTDLIQSKFNVLALDPLSAVNINVAWFHLLPNHNGPENGFMPVDVNAFLCLDYTLITLTLGPHIVVLTSVLTTFSFNA